MSGTWLAGWATNDLVTTAEFKKGVGSVFHTVLSSASASIDTGAVLPTSYAHMLIAVHGRGDTAAASVSVNVRLNNDSTASYYYQRLRGTAATTSAAEGLAATFFQAGFFPANTATANFGGSIVMWIPAYGTATFTKGLSSQNAGPTGTGTGTLFTDVITGVWNNVAAVNRVTILANAGNFVAGTVATIYVMGA